MDSPGSDPACSKLMDVLRCEEKKGVPLDLGDLRTAEYAVEFTDLLGGNPDHQEKNFLSPLWGINRGKSYLLQSLRK